MKDSLLELDVQKTTATMAVRDIAAFKAEFTDFLRTFDDMMKTRASHLNDSVDGGKLESYVMNCLIGKSGLDSVWRSRLNMRLRMKLSQ